MPESDRSVFWIPRSMDSCMTCQFLSISCRMSPRERWLSCISRASTISWTGTCWLSARAMSSATVLKFTCIISYPFLLLSPAGQMAGMAKACSTS